MTTTAEYLAELSRETHQSESALLARAIESGLRQMWRERILGQYLRQEITRESAVASVGSDWVEMAERQTTAMREDLEWANQTARP